MASSSKDSRGSENRNIEMSQGHAEVKSKRAFWLQPVLVEKVVKNWTQDHILKIRLVRPLDGLEGGVRKRN